MPKTVSTVRRGLCIVLVSVLVGAGCGIRRDLEAISRIQARIKADFGVDVFVNVHTANGETTVNVQLGAPAPGDPQVFKTRVEELVKGEFPTATNTVITARM